MERTMTGFHLFKDGEFEFEFLRAIGLASQGGAEIGECLAVARRITDGDIGSWIHAWGDYAAQTETHAHALLTQGHRVSAREALLRASNYYRAAEYFAVPLSPEHQHFWQQSRACFQRACTLLEVPVDPVEIPFEGARLPGYFLRPDASGKPRPTVMMMGGMDSTSEEVCFWSGFAALGRGYNAFVFEGPGQRGALHLNPGLVFRPDFEVPAKAVVDTVLAHPEVDADRLALLGYSFGGYFVPRAAAFDPRIKALVPNSPIPDLFSVMTAALQEWHIPLALAKMGATLKGDPSFKANLAHWEWALGVKDAAGVLERLKAFTLAGLEERITCPTLVLAATGEGRTAVEIAQRFYHSIGSQTKAIHIFTAEEGADNHCQIENNSARNQVIFDWLDTLFAAV